MRMVGAVTVAGALALLATGCGGAGGGGTADAAKKPDKASSTPAPPLPMETAAKKATWTDRDRTRQLKVAPERLVQGKESDLERVRLDGDVDGMVPFYLTVSYTNTGKETLDLPDPENNFTITLADGTPGRPIALMNTNPLATESGVPKECDKSGPATLAPGRTGEACQIVMLPKARTPAIVSYTDEASGALTWKIGDGEGYTGTNGLMTVGQSADAMWQDDNRDVPMTVTLTGMRKGDIGDLSRFQLSADQKKMTPYYVTLRYRNTGAHVLLPTMQDNVGVSTAGGQQLRPTTFMDFSAPGNGIEGCRSAVAHTRLKPKSSLTMCSVHLMPEGDQPVAVTFKGEGRGAHQFGWRVP
ncbi:hypothetical protein ACFZCY_03660 [Streptomyces sp. NPDC007983]|uniref:hypothetical protein n=1 Tax=Streptomyces sp. NPDC007983 TaxID=3364800 RepID=UPI0036E19C23